MSIEQYARLIALEKRVEELEKLVRLLMPDPVMMAKRTTLTLPKKPNDQAR